MTTQLLVTGVEETPAPDADAALRQQFDLRITPRASVQIGVTQRGQAQEVPLAAEDDDLVEFEYSDGGREWMRVDALRRRLGQEAQTRGEETALRVPLTPPGFAPAPTRGTGEALVLPPDAPVVILIPGLLATQLNAGEQTLWLDMQALATGLIDQLALTKEQENAVTPGAIFPEIYQPLQEALAEKYHVIPFPYDWRKSVREAGEQLAALVEEELKTPGRAIHLLGHSTGGLVARAMLAYAPTTWTKLCNRGGRLVMLGVPHGGTYAALDLLSGQAALVQMLALIDPTHPVPSLGALFWGFPGLVELLPQATDAWLPLWATAETNKLRSKAQVQAALKKAQRVWDKLAPALDPVHMRQILGVAPWTPNSVQVDAANQLRFAGTSDGDGVVTVQQGQLPGVPTWYANATHADLCKAPDLLPALLELLEQGQTTQMSRTPLVQTQRGAPQLRAFKLAGFPNEDELTAAVLGGVAHSPLPASRGPATVLRVSVTHASLEYTALPVAVGHYHSDLITGPESALDWRLEGKLSKRRAMNIYPGRVGEAEVILLPSNTPPGALVIGLGEIGELTADIVTRGITEAALRLALIRHEAATNAPDQAAATSTDDTAAKPRQRLSAAFSALLIGIRGGRPLTIENSVAAIVIGALQANRILAAQKLVDQVCVDKVEFVEIYEESAIRAAHAVRNLKQYLRLPLATDEDLDLAEYLHQGEGGYVGQPANGYEEGWWQRLQISEKKDADDHGTGELEFLLLTDRARAELTLQATQRALVNQLVEQTINQAHAASDLTLPTTLYELLLPNNLKNQPLDTSNLLLIVDHLSAQFPWEMLADRRPGEQTITSSQQLRPLSVRKGIVRQLTTGAYRALVQPARGDKALVIGEPRLDPVRYPAEANYPSLPGARAEAEAVATLLTERGYQVTKLIQKDALTIIKALFADDYQIIHIAGHGIYKPESPAQSGVVLGGNLFLTAAEIGQLRVVPEMVFLNCCYLGQMDATPKPTDALQQTQRAWNQLAASISQELIKIGVRAVVAAGWAVNDAAAQAFAEQLYGCMLPVRAKATQGNLPFGEAACIARAYIYDKVNNPPNNTWGAYQCYGDPGFMFNPTARTVRTPEAHYVAPSEILRELRNLQSRASRVSDRNRLATLEQTVQALEAQLPATWQNGEMLYAFGETYAELGNFPQAITRYRDAMKASSPNERVPIRAIEQLANLEARYAQELMSAAPRSGPDPLQGAAWTPADLLNQAERRLNNLNDLAPTPERQALLGSCYKRLAMLASGADRRTRLQAAATCYQKAAQLVKAAGKTEFYHVLNQVTCQFLSGESSDETTRQAWLAALAPDETTQANGIELGFWQRVASADRELASALIQGTIIASLVAIQKLYNDAFNVGATARQQATVLAHIEFVSAMLEGRDDQAATVLRQLYKTLMSYRR